MTQQEFAAALGIAKQTLVDIEGRRKGYVNKISWEMAKRIGLLTGADPRSLVHQNGIAKGVRRTESDVRVSSDDPYCQLDYELWKTAAVAEAEQLDHIDARIVAAADFVSRALRAAKREGPMQMRFLDLEIRESIESHLRAWHIQNAPAGVFSPELRNEEAAAVNGKFNLYPQMTRLLRDRMALRKKGIPERAGELLTAECLNYLARSNSTDVSREIATALVELAQTVWKMRKGSEPAISDELKKTIEKMRKIQEPTRRAINETKSRE